METMRKLIIGLLVAAAVFVLTDFSAAAYCEYRLSKALREHSQLSTDPEVTIHGVPFTVAAIRGKFPQVEIRARGVHRDQMRNTYIEALLSDVEISGGKLFAGDYADAKVETILGRMRIDVTELGQQLGIPDLEIVPKSEQKVKEADQDALPTNDGVVFSGTVLAGGKKVKVNVRANLFISAGALRIVAQELVVDPDEGLPAEITEADQPAIVARFSTVINKLVLPFGAIPRKAWAEGTQIVIEGTSTKVEVALDDLQIK
ncbi:DUF2993 domain-containing protein [Smaragdicoccus niigatensis]